MNRATSSISIHVILITAVFCFINTRLHGQNLQTTAANTAPFTPENLITNIFLGDGVEVSGVTYKGQAVSVGYFSGGMQAVGLERGIVMTTGAVTTLPGQVGSTEIGSLVASNVAGGLLPQTDPDLGMVATNLLYDLTAYTITFIPTSDTLRFRYCFASEEYPEFACSDFNDIFGFFIQGPGYPTPTNIARIPGTALPVAINNLHPDNTSPSRPCSPLNEQYYVNNNFSGKQPVYDGLTHVFTAEAVVTPCQTYTIKLAISDVGDPNLDSGVFLEAKSFGAGSLRTTLSTPGPNNTITEGCTPGAITFHLPAHAEQDYPIDFTLFGSATNGSDFANIPSTLVIPAGEQEITIPIVALDDNLPDSGEFIAFDVRRDPCTRDTLRIYLRDNSIQPPDLLLDTTWCTGAPAVALNGALPIVLPPPPSFTNNQEYNLAPVGSPVFSPLDVFGVLPNTLQPGMIRSVCLNISHGWVDDLDAYLISPGGQFLELMSDCGANGKNFTNTCFTPVAVKNIDQATALAAPFSGDWLPEGLWSDLWSNGSFPVNGQWVLQITDDQNGFSGILHDWTLTFEPSYQIDYQWTPVTGLSCPTCAVTAASPDTTTVYKLRATDSYGCFVDDSARVAVTPTLPAPDVVCGGYTGNSITFTWNDIPGASSYEVNVNGTGWGAASGANSHVAGNLGPGSTVSIEVRAVGNNCTALTGTATCANCQQPVVNIVPKPVSCFGKANGSLSSTVDNLNPPYTFTLNTQTNSTGVFQNLPAGNYTLVVTDNSGCATYVPVGIGSPPKLDVSIAPAQLACFAGDNGVLTAKTSGGTGTLNYQWNDPTGQKGASAVNLIAGAYTVTVTDMNGCSSTASATLTQPPDLVLSVSANLVKCFGDSTGWATASATGGAGPYQFAWSNGQSGPIAANLKASTYTVTITDAAGCAKTSFALIGQAPKITANTTATPETCAGQLNGAATVSAQGGTGSLSFLWSTIPPQSTPAASNLAAGVYTVTITDKSSCTLVQTITVDAPPAIQLNTTGTAADCFKASTGSTQASASGGAGQITFKWSDPAGQSLPTAINLSAGTYTVTASDANGCTATGTATVTQPEPIVLSTTVVNATCFNSPDGQISTKVSGGTPGYTFQWNSAETTASIANKTAGIYSVTVTDASGCTAVSTDTIGQPAELLALLDTQNVRCYGGTNGAAAVEISGGSDNYTVLWSGPNGFQASEPVLENLAAGIYSVSVADVMGCSIERQVVIAQPAAPLLISVPISADTICWGYSNGTATVIPTGGTPPYSYLWDPTGQTGPTATGLASSLYHVVVTDANQCTALDSVLIVQKEQLIVLAEGSTVDCFGSNEGTAAVTALFYGASPANLNSFSYQWSTNPLQTTRQANGLAAGKVYTVTVTDGLGCTATQTVAIDNSTQVTFTFSAVQEPDCFNGANGWAIAAGTGGIAPYTYTWSPNVTGATDSLAQNLAAGTYSVTVSDAQGCTGTASFHLNHPLPLEISFRPTAVDCYGEKTGRLLALPGGGVPPYQFYWSTGELSGEVQHLPAGTYQVTLTDGNGCTVSAAAAVEQPANPLWGTTTQTDIPCFGGHSGQIQIAASGGTPPYRYALDQGNWNGSSKQIGLVAGTYLPRIRDINGCTVDLMPVEIAQRPALELDLGPDIPVLLGQGTQLMASVVNGISPLEFSWNPQDSTLLSCLDCPDPLVAVLMQEHLFELSVTDSVGCTARDQVLVIVEKPRKVFVPTAFSPNGDGANDLLITHGQPLTRVISFQVFDRWGEVLYQSYGFALNDPATGWDGSFRGQPVDPGTYLWILEVEYIDGVRDVFKGNTALIR